MLRDAIDRLLSLAAPTINTFDEVPYSDKVLNIVRPPAPNPIIVHTLTALADYLQGNVDDLPLDKIIVHVEDPESVSVLMALDPKYQTRKYFLRAELINDPFVFNSWMDPETFNIALQTQFIDTPSIAKLLSISGNMNRESSVGLEDDGVTQHVTIKEGIMRKQDAKIPNPWKLQPYRSFTEIGQVESPFVLRMRSDPVSCSLWDCDGGAWKNIAIDRIAEWLSDALPSNIYIIA